MGLWNRIVRKEAALPRTLTLREAWNAAIDLLRTHEAHEAERARLFCLYTSVMDANEIMDRDGRCAAWHVDFFLPRSSNLFLVRFEKGRLRHRVKPWGGGKGTAVEYVFALHGVPGDPRQEAGPAALPEDWADSPEIARALHEFLDPFQRPDHGEPYAPMALCLPGNGLRYLQEEKTRERLRLPPPPDRTCITALCATDELYEEDVFLIYLDGSTGNILASHPFRFPDLFFFGNSVDW